MASTPYPVRLGDERKKAIKAAADATQLPFSETVRKAIDFGLPVLVDRLTKKSKPSRDG